jgi:deoxyribodipyrimidine photo-lyase
MNFPTDSLAIEARIQSINPINYSSNRNYIDGDVSYLSPYISRGYISTKQIMDYVLAKDIELNQVEKFLQELAWRDYWQQIWISKKAEINFDLKQKQVRGQFEGIPWAISEAKTGIIAIDNALKVFYESGYLHNHLRMYLASITCNIAHCQWLTPAKWMYYHLLDADWASNALSWQWVSGANSSKLYFANQDNINKYCYTNQKGTFLDVPYENIEQIEVPKQLKTLVKFDYKTKLPESENLNIDDNLPTFIYNFYNLDPNWHDNIAANRILLFEPSIFEKYPVSENSITFCINLAKENIKNIQIYTGDFFELKLKIKGEIYFKEHPLNNYKGNEEPRDWMFMIKGEYPSFFSFWKKCKKELEIIYKNKENATI